VRFGQSDLLERADVAAGDTSCFSLGCAIHPAVRLSRIPAENQGDHQPSGQWLPTPVINLFPNLTVSVAPDTPWQPV